jgi:hypothetical protein
LSVLLSLFPSQEKARPQLCFIDVVLIEAGRNNGNLVYPRRIVVDTVVFLSGTTRGATLEGIGRSLASGFNEFGIEFVEISLLDSDEFLAKVHALDFGTVKLVFSFVSMGMDVLMNRSDGTSFNLWKTLGMPFLSVHGDSPAYFFDRHVVRDNYVVSLYGFTEHLELRKRLPCINGPVADVWPIVVNETPRHEINFKAKRNGSLIFLKNGKDPAQLRKLWRSVLGRRMVQAMEELASELEANLDNPGNNQIDDLVTRYFGEQGFDVEGLIKLRLFFIAQLDDYLRAVKCTRMVEALLNFPVEIRGNDWGHVDFTGKKAKYIDECDFTKSTGLIRNSLGIIDMSPNTGSRPHDRVMRAYGAYTLCLTNKQQFLDELPHQERLGFQFEKESFQERVADILSHRSDAVEMGVEVAETYRRLHPTEQLIGKMLDWASLVRLNNASAQPAGMQDFFVWPPTRI